MKKKALVFLAFFLSIAGCGKKEAQLEETAMPSFSSTPAPTALPSASPTLEPEVFPEKDGMTTDVPETYIEPVELGGTVEKISYRTQDYTNLGEVITKNAEVYVPYGYKDSREKYPVLYFMHGFQGNSTTIFSTYGGALKNTFDHMIQDGLIPPMIVVAPTFESTDSCVSWQRSAEELKVMPDEMTKDLVPYIDGSFRTIADRNHRIFGGFSMGGVTTWYMFANSMHDFRYYMPFSGDCWVMMEYGGQYATADTAQYLAEAAFNQGFGPLDFMVYACVGTNDQFYQPVALMVSAMRNWDMFTEHNLFFRAQEGAGHDYTAMPEDFYNALPELFYDMKYHSVAQ